MAQLNKVEFIGRLTRDPELRYTKAGQSVCNFSIATNSAWTGKDGEKHEDTEYHRLVAWGAIADAVAEYMAKGRLVYVEAKAKTRKWTKEVTAKSGEVIEVPMETTEFHCADVQFLDRAPEAKTKPATRQKAQERSESTDEQTETEQPQQEQRAAEATPEDEGF